jgi:uncharacterized Zn finger protein
MKCENCQDDIGVIVSPMPDHFLHECTECGWCHRVHRISTDSYTPKATWYQDVVHKRNKH